MVVGVCNARFYEIIMANKRQVGCFSYLLSDGDTVISLLFRFHSCLIFFCFLLLFFLVCLSLFSFYKQFICAVENLFHNVRDVRKILLDENVRFFVWATVASRRASDKRNVRFFPAGFITMLQVLAKTPIIHCISYIYGVQRIHQ